MPIRVKCECGRTLTLKDTAAGKSLPCPACGHIVQVPIPDFLDQLGIEVGDPEESPEPAPILPTPPSPPPSRYSTGSNEPAEPVPSIRPRRLSVVKLASVIFGVILPLIGLAARFWPAPDRAADPLPPSAPMPATAPTSVLPDRLTKPQIELLLAAKRADWLLASLDAGRIVDQDGPEVYRFQRLLEDVHRGFLDRDDGQIVLALVDCLNKIRERRGVAPSLEEFLSSMVLISQEWRDYPKQKQPFADIASFFMIAMVEEGTSSREAVGQVRAVHRALFADQRRDDPSPPPLRASPPRVRPQPGRQSEESIRESLAAGHFVTVPRTRLEQPSDESLLVSSGDVQPSSESFGKSFRTAYNQQSRTLIRMARSLDLVGNVKGATEHYEEAVKRAPDSTSAQLAREELREIQARGRYDLSRLESFQVVQVEDGETIMLSQKGRRLSARLIGVSAPGQETTNFLRKLLSGKTVCLEREPTPVQAGPADMVRAYIYRSPDGLFVNREIIRLGYGRTSAIRFSKAEEFRAAEQQARERSENASEEAGSAIRLDAIPPTGGGFPHLTDFAHVQLSICRLRIGRSVSLTYSAMLSTSNVAIAFASVLSHRILIPTQLTRRAPSETPGNALPGGGRRPSSAGQKGG